MKYKYLIIIILLLLTLTISCNKKENVSKTKEEETEETVLEKHTIESHRFSTQYFSPSIAGPSYIPSNYKSTITISFDSFEEFDYFMNNKLKEEFNFIYPLIVNDESFNYKEIAYVYYLDNDTYNELMNKGIENYNELLEDIDYDLSTGYGEVYLRLGCNDPESSDDYNEPIRISYAMSIGKFYNEYLENIKELTGDYFDVFDLNNYYKEIRCQSINDTIYVDEFFDLIQVHNGSTAGCSIRVTAFPEISSDVFHLLNDGKIEEAKDIIEEAEKNNYRIYDQVYEKIIDYGFKIYSNKINNE